MRPRPYFDVKQHLLFLHKQVLPLFFFLCALAMLGMVVFRAGQGGAPLPEEGFVASRVGLQRPVPGEAFDPAWAILSPIEMVLAPAAPVTGRPLSPASLLSGNDPVPVRAVADGWVQVAAEDRVVLVHDGPGSICQSEYTGLSGLRVGAGSRVRRGGEIGSAVPDSLRVRWRRDPSLALLPAGSDLSLPESGRLAPPPQGEPIEARPLTLEGTKPAAP